MDDWTRALAGELGVDLDTITGSLDKAALQALARDATKAFDRPSGPWTTFLVGYAAGMRGGGSDAVAQCAASARVLARSWRHERELEEIGGEA